MTARTLIGLAVALVVLTALAIWGQRDGDDVSGAAGIDRLLVPELQPALDRVDRVSVVGAGNASIATLVRQDDRWVVTEKDGYPADIGRLRDVLRALAEARVVETKTANPGFYDRLGVSPIEDEDAAGIAVAAHAGDEEIAAVIVGDTAGSGYHYARRPEVDASVMVDREIDVPRDVAEWVDPTIVDIRGARVQEVVIEQPDGGTLRISKDGEDQANFSVEGVPEGRELQYPGVANVIGNALRELRLEDVEAAEPASEPEPVRTTYRTFDGLVVTVRGSTRDDGSAWIELEADTVPTAPASAPESGDDAAGDEDNAAGNAAADGADGADDTGPDPGAEAAEINRRVAGWRYRIPTYQFDQMTRRMDDLLRAETEAEE